MFKCTGYCNNPWCEHWLVWNPLLVQLECERQGTKSTVLSQYKGSLPKRSLEFQYEYIYVQCQSFFLFWYQNFPFGSRWTASWFCILLPDFYFGKPPQNVSPSDHCCQCSTVFAHGQHMKTCSVVLYSERLEEIWTHPLRTKLNSPRCRSQSYSARDHLRVNALLCASCVLTGHGNRENLVAYPNRTETEAVWQEIRFQKQTYQVGHLSYWPLHLSQRFLWLTQKPKSVHFFLLFCFLNATVPEKEKKIQGTI